MAKNELMDSAKKLETKAAELLERIKQLHCDVSASLQQAKKQESKLLDAERAAAEAKA